PNLPHVRAIPDQQFFPFLHRAARSAARFPQLIEEGNNRLLVAREELMRAQTGQPDGIARGSAGVVYQYWNIAIQGLDFFQEVSGSPIRCREIQHNSDTPVARQFPLS